MQKRTRERQDDDWRWELEGTVPDRPEVEE
jgi:hypothetical protein